MSHSSDTLDLLFDPALISSTIQNQLEADLKVCGNAFTRRVSSLIFIDRYGLSAPLMILVGYLTSCPY
jgi:hypothetical protein